MFTSDMYGGDRCGDSCCSFEVPETPVDMEERAFILAIVVEHYDGVIDRLAFQILRLGAALVH